MVSKQLFATAGVGKHSGIKQQEVNPDRLKRSRERNRIHARKTRQRKKEQMQNLQSRAEDLKSEQMRLRQIINEKNTASILVGLFAKSSSETNSSIEDPKVEDLLKRPADQIPDASKVSELPALILPGQHASRKNKTPTVEEPQFENRDDGIDYDLLGKDRSKCSPEELDQIRRERNRMHAKRTRDRKRLFTEQMSGICRQLEDENRLLLDHLGKIDPDYVFESTIPPSDASTPTLASQPASRTLSNDASTSSCSVLDSNCHQDQIMKLLEAASAFEKPQSSKRARSNACTSASTTEVLQSVASSLVAMSDDSSASDESHNGELEVERLRNKRRRASSHSAQLRPPLVGSAATTVGC